MKTRGVVWRAEFSPNGTFVFGWADGSCSDVYVRMGAPVWLWNATSGEFVRTIAGSTEQCRVIDAALSPDERFLLTTCHQDRTMRLWQVSTGKFVRIVDRAPDGNGDFIRTICFSAEGAYALIFWKQEAPCHH